MDTCTTKFEHKLSSALLLTESTSPGEIIRAINKLRKQKRLEPVIPNNVLASAAKIQTKQLVTSNTFGHVVKGGKYPTLDDRTKRFGINDRCGEVLYAGADSDAEMVVQAWLGSKPHREAILHPDIEEIGVSIKHYSDGRVCICGVVCIPSDGGDEVDDEYAPRDIADRVIGVAKEYGKKAAKQLLAKAVESDYVKKSPIIQKIIKALQ